jgi:hypothetical protein
MTNGVLGIIFTALFLVLRVYMKQYQLRLVSKEERRGGGGGDACRPAGGDACRPARSLSLALTPLSHETIPSARHTHDNRHRHQQHLPFVTIKPPPMPTRGFKALL